MKAAVTNLQGSLAASRGHRSRGQTESQVCASHCKSMLPQTRDDVQQKTSTKTERNDCHFKHVPNAHVQKALVPALRKDCTTCRTIHMCTMQFLGARNARAASNRRESKQLRTANMPRTLITCPFPRTKSKGAFRSTELSNLLPSAYKVPCTDARLKTICKTALFGQ